MYKKIIYLALIASATASINSSAAEDIIALDPMRERDAAGSLIQLSTNYKNKQYPTNHTYKNYAKTPYAHLIERKQYRCTRCVFNTPNKTTIQNHCLTHVHKKYSPFSCTLCPSGLTYACLNKYRIRTHCVKEHLKLFTPGGKYTKTNHELKKQVDNLVSNMYEVQ